MENKLSCIENTGKAIGVVGELIAAKLDRIGRCGVSHEHLTLLDVGQLISAAKKCCDRDKPLIIVSKVAKGPNTNTTPLLN
jgi:hypothetical protein